MGGIKSGRSSWTERKSATATPSTPLAAGVIIGAAVSLWASSFVASLLYDIQPRDPATFGGAGAPLAGVALVASWLPACRAARIDPMKVLRA